MMDVDEFGESTSSVILSLMGVDDRPRKKLIREHQQRVLSDEYHQRVASMDSHVRRSSFKCYSFGTSQNCENIEASAAIGQNKRCKKSIHNEEEMSDVASLEKAASGGTGLVDELLSGIYSSHITPRHYPSLDNSSKALSNLRARFSRKRSLSSSYADNKYDWFSARLGGCVPKSQSSVVSTARGVEGGENAASEPTAESEDAVRKVHVQAEDGEVRLSGNPNMLGVPTSRVTLKRNYGPSPANISVNATELIYEAEQETSSYDSEDSFSTNRSSIETDSFKSFDDEYLHSPDSVLESFYEEKSSSDVIAKLSEQATRLNSFGFDPSTAWSGEIQTTGLSDATREDHCEGGPTIQDNDSRPARIGESREFHYLVEILTEAGFCRTNLISSLDRWHTLESPMSPFVFEMVEKRYTDNKSWEASDRVLLFDRMNSCLEGILQGSTLNPSRHLRARNSDRFRYDADIDEEALWSTLVKEGKELKGETIEDLLERDLRSLDLAEFIESVVAEIEWSAIDVLIAELVNGE